MGNKGCANGCWVHFHRAFGSSSVGVLEAYGVGIEYEHWAAFQLLAQ
jgi:hypothetical protein